MYADHPAMCIVQYTGHFASTIHAILQLLLYRTQSTNKKHITHNPTSNNMQQLEMWANAQPDGRPLFNAAKFG